MTSVEFRNLIGRVGRIKFNLYGNVFFISNGNQVTEKEYVRLLREPILEQKLSIVQELKPKLKKYVAETLLSGSSKIEPYDTKSQKQSEEEYVMMRKFGLILLKDIMEVIENVILFSISNYFLRFSNMHIAINGEHSLDYNNWYEFVEYGTINEITVFLQRNRFSRESANYIKDHPEYIFRQGGVLMLRRSLLKCKNNHARTEAELISLNRPKLFEE